MPETTRALYDRRGGDDRREDPFFKNLDNERRITGERRCDLKDRRKDWIRDGAWDSLYVELLRY